MFFISGCGRVDEPLRSSDVTRLIGSETDPAVSPDGKTVCFAWRDSRGVVNLYSKPLDGEGDFRQLTADPEIEASPRWSPDGRWIAYLRYASADDETTSVRLMSIWGGEEREVAVIQQERNDEGTLDWTRDGAFLIVGGLSKIAIGDGSITPLGVTGDQPAVSPDGRAVVYRRGGAIFRASLGSTPSERQLADKGMWPQWSADGKEIIYSEGGKLWRRENATGGLLGELELNELRLNDVRAAATVRNGPFVYTRDSEKTEVWKLDVADHRMKRVVEGDWPDVSADGKLIVFTNGGGEIRICDAEGRDARPIHVRRGETVMAPVFDASGRTVTFVVNGEEYIFYRDSGTVKKSGGFEGRRSFPAEKLPHSPFLAARPASVTADGGTVVFAQLASRGWDIRKIDNYR